MTPRSFTCKQGHEHQRRYQAARCDHREAERAQRAADDKARREGRLTDTQVCRLRAVAEMGRGVAIEASTARALERRGLIADLSPALMGMPGRTATITDAGREALR